MVKLTLELIVKILKALVTTATVTLLFDQILTIGDTPFQSYSVFSFYVFCVLALFEYSENKLFYVLAIPIFTQFVHIFQRYSFPAGANSLWRLFPFILLSFYFLHFIAVSRDMLISQNQKTFVLSWLTISLFYLVISPNLEMIAGGGIILYSFTLPGYYLYLLVTCQAIDFHTQLEKYLTLLFVLLATGTYGLIYFAAGYQGSDNLLVTRNIADTNITMAYFILLWPFTLLYLNRQRTGWIFVPVVALMLLSVVALSFSRGAVILIIPYLCFTLLFAKRKAAWIFILFTGAFLLSPVIFQFFSDQEIVYSWSLRFSDIFDSDSVWAHIQANSGRVRIQQVAYELFLQHPLIGNGIGSFEILGPGFREAHSLFYTLLAEQGILGTTYMYACFGALGISLIQFVRFAPPAYNVLPLCLAFYLAFNHTVGSVFVIIPAKSISVNCIAPILLLCLYFYATSATPSNPARTAP
jgi:O-antigen ligase